MHEEDYVKGVIENIPNWVSDCACYNDDARHTWEYLKYKIRQFSIIYGKKKAKKLRDKEAELEKELKLTQEELHENSVTGTDRELVDKITKLTSELEEIDAYKTEGLILKSRCRWYEKGE